MQDKEIDELFSGQLANFEMQPSPSVWNKVAAGLDNKHSKKRVGLMLAAAASVLALLTAGILFLNKKTDTGKAEQHNNIAVIRKDTRPNTRSEINEQTVKQPATTGQQPTAMAVSSAPVIARTAHPTKSGLIKQPKSVVSSPSATPQVTIPPVSVDEQEQQQQVLAAVVQHKTDVSKPVVPDITLNTAATQPEQTDNTSVVSTTTQVSNTIKPKKRGIRSFGDIVNAVVAKVDKRTDKVIEFSNTDDDESTITGLNLGIVKIKKEK
jgi:hypothetical protein